MNTFSDFGLLHSLLRTLKELKIGKPTEVQKNILPLLMSGQSVVGISETGSGKTLSYVLPILHQLKTLEEEGQAVVNASTPRAVIMVPTRELGEQVSKVFKSLTHDTRVRVRAALGGMTMEQSRRNTAGEFEVLVATPGRILQLVQNEDLFLDDVRTLVFDEADQMMDQGFLPDSLKIFKACPEGIQLALFSATVSQTVQKLMNEIFENAEVYRSASSGKTVSTLKTVNKTVKDGLRWPVLEKILGEKIEGRTILFANTREQCDKIYNELKEKGYEAVLYRGEMEKTDRRRNLKQFISGDVSLLVATDLAGRGLDIPSVERVINYHLPKQKENYLHRVGRTARAGRFGIVFNLVTERDERFIAELEGKKWNPPTKKSTTSKSTAASPKKKALPKKETFNKTPYKAPKKPKLGFQKTSAR